MYDDYSEMTFAEQRRKAIHDEVRQQHLANQIHRTKSANINQINWLNILRRLYHLRIHVSFDLEEPDPKPKVIG
jgi:hypothetical protein